MLKTFNHTLAKRFKQVNINVQKTSLGSSFAFLLLKRTFEPVGILANKSVVPLCIYSSPSPWGKFSGKPKNYKGRQSCNSYVSLNPVPSIYSQDFCIQSHEFKATGSHVSYQTGRRAEQNKIAFLHHLILSTIHQKSWANKAEKSPGWETSGELQAVQPGRVIS